MTKTKKPSSKSTRSPGAGAASKSKLSGRGGKPAARGARGVPSTAGGKRPGEGRKAAGSGKAGASPKLAGKSKRSTAPRRSAAELAGNGHDAAAQARSDERYAASRENAEAAVGAALDKKALVPVLIDVSGRASYTDFIAVVSGRSDRQVEAIAEGITVAMKERGSYLLGREGSGNGRWTLLDFGDVIVHVFYHPVREVYDIEGLWIDAPRIELDVPPEARHVQPDAYYPS